MCLYFSLSLSLSPTTPLFFIFLSVDMAPALWLKIWKFFFEISIRSVRKIFFLKYYLSGRKNRSIVKIVKVCRFVVVVSKLSWNQWIGIPILTARNNRWETDRKSGGLFFFLSVSLYLSPPRTDPYESINGALFRIIRFLLPITLLSLTSLSPSCVLFSPLPFSLSLSLSVILYTHPSPRYSSFFYFVHGLFFSHYFELELTKIVRFFL